MLRPLSRWTFPLALLLAFSLMHGEREVLEAMEGAEPPYVDAFLIYYEGRKDEAFLALESLMDRRAVRALAQVNFGVLLQMEKKPVEAIRYFRDAHASGARMALSYLFSAREKLEAGAPEKLLKAISQRGGSSWTQYELALMSLERGNEQEALALLEEAAGRGLNAALLADREPLFNRIRSSERYRTIHAKMKENSHSASLVAELGRTEQEDRISRPFGARMEIMAAAHSERKGNLAGAVDLIEEMTRKECDFRDMNMGLYRIARLKARQGDAGGAHIYLRRFLEHLKSDAPDGTGYKEIMRRMYRDILLNDTILKDHWAAMGTQGF